MSDNTQTRTAIARCPDCGEKIRLTGRVFVGMAVDCPECDAALEVIATEPVELDWADDDSYDEDQDDEEW